MNPRQARWLLTGAVAAYTIWLAWWVGPDPWMWRVWAGVAVLLALIVGALVFITRQDDTTTPTPTVLKGMVPGVVATLGFAVVAVLAAVLETRPSDTLEGTYWALGIGMMLVVALYLSSYDRRRA